MSVQELTDLIGRLLADKIGADAEFEVIHERGKLVVRANDQVFHVDISTVGDIGSIDAARDYTGRRQRS